MKDLISREAVIERIKYEADVCNSGITRGVLKFLQAIVENMPSAIDAVEVVHGRWICHEIEGTLRWKECPKCKFEIPNLKYNYCPNCGARMDGE